MSETAFSEQPASAARPTPEEQMQALRVALRILERWGCTPEEKAILLGVGTSTLYKLEAPHGRQRPLPRDLMERVSYLLNIHAALRTLFELPESLYGWVRKPSSDPFYAGRSALEIMLQGRVADLYEVARRLGAVRGGWG